MAKLTKGERDRLPSKDFAGPGRSFPINDKIHAEKAIQLAPRAEKAGHISEEEKERIDAKARKKLHGALALSRRGKK